MEIKGEIREIRGDVKCERSEIKEKNCEVSGGVFFIPSSKSKI